MYIHALRGKHVNTRRSRLYRREASNNDRWLIGEPSLLDRMAIARLAAPDSTAKWYAAAASLAAWITFGLLVTIMIVAGLDVLAVILGTFLFVGAMLFTLSETIPLNMNGSGPSVKLADAWLDRKSLQSRVIQVSGSRSLDAIAKVTGKESVKEIDGSYKAEIDSALGNPYINDAYRAIDTLTATGNTEDQQRVSMLREGILKELEPLRQTIEQRQLESSNEADMDVERARSLADQMVEQTLPELDS